MSGAGADGQLWLARDTYTAETAQRVWTEIGESVARAGLRKMIIVTSHGGNVDTMRIVARELRVNCQMLVVTTGWRFGPFKTRSKRACGLAASIPCHTATTSKMRSQRRRVSAVVFWQSDNRASPLE